MNKPQTSDLPPQEIMRGFSPSLTELDRVFINQKTEIEREWYKDSPRFADNDSILQAYSDGQLVKVTPGANYRPVTRFINPDLHGVYPPFLTPETYTLLGIFSQRWRQRANDLGIAENVRFAVTSMTRSEAYQKELVAQGKLAVLDSTHTTGNAFDIDLSGYYEVNESGETTSVSLRSHDDQKPIKGAFMRMLGVEHPAGYDVTHSTSFDKLINLTLLETAEEMRLEGMLNHIIEFPHTKNEGLHIALNPLV